MTVKISAIITNMIIAQRIMFAIILKNFSIYTFPP